MILLVFTLLFFNISYLFSQNKYDRSYLKGLYSIQFGISDNFRLSTFEGSLLSVKYNFTEKTALRIALSIYANSTNNVNQHFRQDTLYVKTINEDDGKSSSISLLLLRRIRDRDYISVYFGVGPFVSYNKHRTHDETYYYNNDTNPFSDGQNNYWDLGLAGLLGSEVFVTKYISIFAEYNCRYRYRYIKSNGERRTELTTTKTKSSEFKSLSLKFGLSVYF